jgi:hypothetical protein
MKKLLLFLSAFFILGTMPNCSKKAYSQKEGLMLTDKYDRPGNKKKSKKPKKNYKKRQKQLNKSRR